MNFLKKIENKVLKFLNKTQEELDFLSQNLNNDEWFSEKIAEQIKNTISDGYTLENTKKYLSNNDFKLIVEFEKDFYKEHLLGLKVIDKYLFYFSSKHKMYFGVVYEDNSLMFTAFKYSNNQYTQSEMESFVEKNIKYREETLYKKEQEWCKEESLKN